MKLDRPISVLALTHSLAEGLGYLLNPCKSQISLLSNRNPLALLWMVSGAEVCSLNAPFLYPSKLCCSVDASAYINFVSLKSVCILLHL